MGKTKDYFDILADLDFDEVDINYKVLDICGLVKKMNSQKRIMEYIKDNTLQLKFLINNFDNSKVYKFISVKGGFSSINFIDYVCENEIIENLFICSLAVGKKHIQHLDSLFKKKRIINCNFILGTLFEKRGLDQKYDYYDIFTNICKKNKWNYFNTNNHCKIILMRTNLKNYYVLETSSNLNENPKIEQFSFENNEELYKFYYDFFKEVK